MKKNIIISVFVVCLILCFAYIIKNTEALKSNASLEKSQALQGDNGQEDSDVGLSSYAEAERIYVPLTLIAEVENPNLWQYEGYHFDMDNFIWFVKYETLETIEADYKITLKDKDKYEEMDCDYVISFGNKLSKLYYCDKLVMDDTSALRYTPYPIFEREHHKNIAYIYMLDKRYNFADPEYATNMILDFNKSGVIPYDE